MHIQFVATLLTEFAFVLDQKQAEEILQLIKALTRLHTANYPCEYKFGASKENSLPTLVPFLGIVNLVQKTKPPLYLLYLYLFGGSKSREDVPMIRLQAVVLASQSQFAEIP